MLDVKIRVFLEQSHYTDRFSSSCTMMSSPYGRSLELSARQRSPTTPTAAIQTYNTQVNIMTCFPEHTAHGFQKTYCVLLGVLERRMQERFKCFHILQKLITHNCNENQMKLKMREWLMESEQLE